MLGLRISGVNLTKRTVVSYMAARMDVRERADRLLLPALRWGSSKLYWQAFRRSSGGASTRRNLNDLPPKT